MWIGFLLIYVVGASSFAPDNSQIWKRAFVSKKEKLARSANTGTEPEPTTPSRSSSVSSQWWDDLAPPFSLPVEYNVTQGDATDDSDEDNYEEPYEGPQVTHFCFLVHGHRGLSKDLSYLQHVMQSGAAIQRRLFRKQKRQQQQEHDASQDTATQRTRHDMVVHSTVCNEGRTTDGVANGGQRLVEEMLEVIRTEMQRRYPNAEEVIHNVTLSVVGNSLGGVYGRYAVAKLSELLVDSDGILDGKYKVDFNVFCTTATPHLGLSKYTFVPLPRTAEIGMAHALGSTGRDLFRLNDLMKTMATDQKFLGPLGAFRKRIAYANAYGTDLPVPAGTAAFLCDDSNYPHHFVLEEQVEGDDVGLLVDDATGLVICTLHTPPRNPQEEEPVLDAQHENELVHMSSALDALGWKKVFVDVRQEIPGVNLPQALSRRWSSTNTNDNQNGEGKSTGEEGEEDEDPLNALRRRGVVESRDVATAVKLSPNGETPKRLSLPIGHNMIVAFSRSRISSYINKGGRPVVDQLARDLVADICKWNDDKSN